MLVQMVSLEQHLEHGKYFRSHVFFKIYSQQNQYYNYMKNCITIVS